ncbi:MAG: tRNA (adenosine(37)-N6)-dimethylallyltransferase MiaA [Rhodospirillales bacterium]|nr:tRNA (adenosine(37)-N6)-dimethylallyltransferase MiaA [Rhodospirillales bacterium]MCB9996335.1 tRNA (adenosine(37)-N6)-dimethylallyltransferase MiaA [Rhodospirillales bacterium]
MASNYSIHHTPCTIHVIYGPTASGKTALALELAARHDGIIINADSMQIYDSLHVLTAQPSQQEQAQAPHRLYAHMAPQEKCSAASWRELAAAEIEQALANDKTPIIVGGTGFYLKALIEGLSPIPDVPPDVRADAMALQAAHGNPAFHAALAERDPDMAARLNPNDTQRLVRAWEVLTATGKSLAYWQSLPAEGPPEHWQFEKHFVNPEREILYDRCNARFDMMLDHGILDEVKTLDAQITNGTVRADAAITHALGFHPLRDYLHGACTLEDAIDLAKQETRNYAKRQVSWLKNQI